MGSFDLRGLSSDRGKKPGQGLPTPDLASIPEVEAAVDALTLPGPGNRSDLRTLEDLGAEPTPGNRGKRVDPAPIERTAGRLGLGVVAAHRVTGQPPGGHGALAVVDEDGQRTARCSRWRCRAAGSAGRVARARSVRQ